MLEKPLGRFSAACNALVLPTGEVQTMLISSFCRVIERTLNVREVGCGSGALVAGWGVRRASSIRKVGRYLADIKFLSGLTLNRPVRRVNQEFRGRFSDSNPTSPYTFNKQPLASAPYLSTSRPLRWRDRVITATFLFLSVTQK